VQGSFLSWEVYYIALRLSSEVYLRLVLLSKLFVAMLTYLVANKCFQESQLASSFFSPFLCFSHIPMKFTVDHG